MNTNIMEKLQINTDVVIKVLVGYIQDEVQKAGRQRAILGLSGGVDSAVIAYLSALALGSENVIVIRMPYATSSADSLSDAEKVINDLNLTSILMPITTSVDAYFAQPANVGADKTRRGNVMARMRMVTLYDQSEIFKALVMGTSNKTEFLLGYTTIYGDAGAANQTIADLYKTQIRQLAHGLNVPKSIVNKPPSADLFAGQTDEQDLGFTYELADQVLYYLIDEQLDPFEVIEMGYDATMVVGMVRKVYWNHFKRTMPNVAKLSNRTIGHDYLYMRNYRSTLHL